MGTCLGICLGDKLVKYAKLEQDDKTKKISLNSYGTKYVTGDADSVISSIISETTSASVPVCLNLENSYRINTEILKQLSKSDANSVINLEVSDFATSKNINEKTLEHRYVLSNSRRSTDSFSAEIYIAEKSEIEKYTNDDLGYKVVGLYPKEHILNNLVRYSNNYAIVNVEDNTTISFVCGGKVTKITNVEVGMKNILDSIAEREGSYTKAYDICRGINVYTDDENLGPDLEKIIEPVIQDLLNRVNNVLAESGIKIDRIYLNGLINLFINIEVLFEQFFNINTEKLTPDILEKEEKEKYNIAEVIEANDAIALAYMGLQKEKNELNFIVDNSKFGLKGIKFGGNEKGKKKTFVLPNVNKEKIESALLFANLTAGTVLTGYVAFTAIYNAEMNSLAKKVTERTNALKVETTKINEDKTYVTNNADKYTTYNKYITETVEKIRSGKIGKYTTYNVANFMQKIAKYIPSNVQLEKISSDDNKSVTIVAKSTSYAELGYFISQLKLEGILENVKTGKVEHGNYITVTIGGDLP